MVCPRNYDKHPCKWDTLAKLLKFSSTASQNLKFCLIKVAHRVTSIIKNFRSATDWEQNQWSESPNHILDLRPWTLHVDGINLEKIGVFAKPHPGKRKCVCHSSYQSESKWHKYEVLDLNNFCLKNNSNKTTKIEKIEIVGAVLDLVPANPVQM